MVSDALAKSGSQGLEFKIRGLIQSEIDPHATVEGEVFFVERGRVVGECRKSFEAVRNHVSQLLKLQRFYGKNADRLGDDRKGFLADKQFVNDGLIGAHGYLPR